MQRKQLIYLLSILCFLLGYNSVAQNKDNKAIDSLQHEAKKAWEENERIRFIDSVKIATLQEELQNAKHKSSSEQAQIENELSLLKAQDSLRVFQQTQLIEKLRKETKGAPVMLFYDTLYYIYAPLGSFTALQRARNEEERLLELYNKAAFNPDSLIITSQFGILTICYNNTVIKSISTTDAMWLGITADSLAQASKDRITERIHYFRKAYTTQNVLIRIAYSVLVLCVLYLVIRLINFIFNKVLRRFTLRSKALKKGLYIRKYEVLSYKNIILLLRQVFNVLRLVLNLMAVYIALTFLFSIFPATRSWTHTLINWISLPLKNAALGFIHYIPNLITILIIVFIVRFIVRGVRFLSIEVERGILKIRGFHKEWARTTYAILRFLIYAFSFVIIFPYLPGSDSDAFKGVSVFLGVLFSIGSSSTIANTIAGLVITYMRPFKVGDWIKVGEIVGCVIEKSALVTRLRTIHNEDITVPNSTILSSHTTNFSSSAAEKGLLISAHVTLQYDIDSKKVIQLLKEAALQTNDTWAEKEPFVFQQRLEDYYVKYEVNVYTQKPERMFYIQSELNQKIREVFNAAGITLMSPQQIHVRQP